LNEEALIAIFQRQPHGSLEKDEHRLLKKLLDKREELINAASEEELDALLLVTSKAEAVLKTGISVLRPLMGKILLRMQENKKHEELGYKTFDDFMTNGAQKLFGLPRSAAYGAKNIAKKFPTMSLEEHAQIGPEKMRIASRITDESDPGCKGILQKASEMTVEAFEDYAERTRSVTKESGRKSVVIIPCSQEQQQMWDELIADTDIHNAVDSSDPGRILEAMIEECRSEWKAAATVNVLA